MPISVESAQRRYFEAVKIGDLIATGAAALAWFWVLDLAKVLSTDEGALLLSQGGGVATAIGKALGVVVLLLPAMWCLALWDGRLTGIAKPVAAMRRITSWSGPSPKR
ncbi:hypothetical protein [Streptomyces griseoluteus]|uniref:hypothetical protein n=1 Tax=Streptomyces griseoluteus TaxID=29306 RepID=UPI0036F6E863